MHSDDTDPPLDAVSRKLVLAAWERSCEVLGPDTLLKLDEIQKICTKQHGRCAVSGIRFDQGVFAAVLTKVDLLQPHSRRNSILVCQWVHDLRGESSLPDLLIILDNFYVSQHRRLRVRRANVIESANPHSVFTAEIYHWMRWKFRNKRIILECRSMNEDESWVIIKVPRFGDFQLNIGERPLEVDLIEVGCDDEEEPIQRWSLDEPNSVETIQKYLSGFIPAVASKSVRRCVQYLRYFDTSLPDADIPGKD